jgi:acrylyl-CoA reductase (NADPH)/3-hydroxypropionyl-CoA dehydratase/3-hydroxypropionyl-CoA synthetase
MSDATPASPAADDRRREALADPGAFHGGIASGVLHWFAPQHQAWLTLGGDGRWTGWSLSDGAALVTDLPAAWRPWRTAFSDADAPFYRWFEGGLTNACFNEVDRHVLGGRGEHVALVFEGDRWDPAKHGGRGGPVQERHFTYRHLLVETVRAAEVLKALGLVAGDRIALNLPSIPQQVFFTEGAKRLGILYTPVFGGFSAKTLADRIADAGARVVITADGGYRNAEVVPFKEQFTDRALDTHLPLAVALAAARGGLSDAGDRAAALMDVVANALAGEITVERGDVMRELGRALAADRTLPPTAKASLRTAAARALAAAEPVVEKVVVVRHTGQDIAVRPRDVWAHDLLAEATGRMLENARAAGFRVASEEDLLALGDRDLWRALAASSVPAPVDADWPMFMIYTSGSTGKPKGVVHVHGGWLAGLVETMHEVFGVTPEDRIYTVADPGWITGQAYLIAAPFACGITTIQVEGSPLFPNAGRFTSIMERHRVTIFKAGSTFLKTVMTDPQSVADMAAHDLSRLKVGTFCAEPVSPAVQRFAMDNLCARYINSYWATEHGGIVLSRPWTATGELAADARTWPLPWVAAEVRVAEDGAEGGVRGVGWRRAEPGERGELVLTQPYPYLARTIWGDPERLGTPEWKGDIARFREIYFDRWDGGFAYTQGDYARVHPDGALTLHGRSDDVINTSGHRIGTEEIEGAILRDKILRPESPVGNVVVVGAPHEERGQVPVAFLVPAPGRVVTGDDRRRLDQLVRSEKGAPAVPDDYLIVSQFPETRSGKYMRRMLRALLLEEPVGDTSTLRNPESIDEIRRAVAGWREYSRLSEERRVLEQHRYLEVETHGVAPGREVAIVRLTHPPVNALNERSLDELLTVFHHLGRREAVAAVVVTGSGTTFVAGADVKELLEVGETGERDGALTLPHAAHAAFDTLEQLGKPVIAAVNGPALGGGNELAMACTWIVAEALATFGQPEVNLRLLPGYGGTQRLPRRCAARRGTEGLVQAIRLIVTGRTIEAGEALSLGLVDEVVGGAGDPRSAVERAVDLARSFARGEGPILEAYAVQQRELARRNEPLSAGEGVLADARVAALVDQARLGGRSRAVDRILDALRTGFRKGAAHGAHREAELFADAVCDPESGPAGIEAFLEKRSTPLPVRPTPVPVVADEATRQQLEREGRLLPLGASFFPGVTPIPPLQYAEAVIKDPATGVPVHGDPLVAEHLVVVPVPQPGPNDALVYMLTSEVNYNDVWAITGIPVSPFDARDVDYHVTGSGGAGLVASLGSELKREGRISVGDLVAVYSGQSELLSPDMGLDPMAADFRIQGYERSDGSHAQFLLVQGPQLHLKLPDLTFEEAGSYGLNTGTIARCLFTTLQIEPGQRLFVEGAATGTGLECLKIARKGGLEVSGMVSSAERGARVRECGGHPVDRKDPRWASAFTLVPDDPAAVPQWVEEGRAFIEDVWRAVGGPIDVAVSHAGSLAFPRTFQTLGPNGVLAFFGASSGYRFTFVGKDGSTTPEVMLRRAGLRSGSSILIVYGPGAGDSVIDEVAIEAIEAARAFGARTVAMTDTDAQRELLLSLGFGEALAGAVSLQELTRRLGEEFVPPGPFPHLPDPRADSMAFKEVIRVFNDRTLKPIGAAIGPYLRTQVDRRGLPDVVFERAGRDGLSLATALVKPMVGRVVLSENLAGRRFTFYAPQVWMRQRRILMPTAEIRGTHLNTAREFVEMNERIAAGLADVTPTVDVEMTDLPSAHQAMWENRHAGATYLAIHALPRAGLKTREELFRAWALRDAAARGERVERIDTGSAEALR